MNPDQTVPKGSGSILFAMCAGKGYNILAANNNGEDAQVRQIISYLSYKLHSCMLPDIALYDVANDTESTQISKITSLLLV